MDASPPTFRLKNIEVDHMTTDSRIFHSKVKHAEQQRKRPSFCLLSSAFPAGLMPFQQQKKKVCLRGRVNQTITSCFAISAYAEGDQVSTTSSVLLPPSALSWLLRRHSSYSRRCVKFSGKSPFWALAPRANQSLSLMPVSQPASCSHNNNNNNVGDILQRHR